MSNLLRDLQSSPALSLTLAGIFRDGAEEEAAEISSENSGAGNNNIKSSDVEYFGEQINVDIDEDEENNNESKKKKRKTYHRHTPEQIREMEALFKESPHPDEKQRLQLSKELGLHPRQVKFWFQNRRTQIKAVQERHENSILKDEIDKLREEIKSLRDIINNPSCPNCGFSTSRSKDEAITSNNTLEQKLRIENAKLKSEVEKLRSIITGKNPSPNSSSYTSANDQENRQSGADYCSVSSSLERSHVTNAVNRAMDELVKMATCGEPLWIRSYETGREILNYDVYVKEFCDGNVHGMQMKKAIEASRESVVVFADLPWLVRTFMDANQWKELFPTLVSKATTLDIVSNGEGLNKDGAIHLMFEEIQMLTPMVATREIYFFRHCKQLSTNKWVVVDVSIDKIEDKIDESMLKCRKRPSGCIIEDNSNGHCKVTWLEHLECQKSTVPSLYRSIFNNGIAFGAKRWISSLQQQCERLVFAMATNVPTRDSSGVSTLAGRKNLLKLAQRMTSSFCKALGSSSFNSWSKITGKSGEDTRISCRKNLNDPGEPFGTIMCSVSSVWLPISHNVLFDFLRDDTRRNEWDITCNGNALQLMTNLAKGQDRGNAVTVLAMETDEQKLRILQDSTTNACESLVVYAHVDTNSMKDVMTGCDSSNVTILPSGFSIIPDGIEYRPLVITSKTEEKNTEGGSLLTVAFQMLISDSPTAKLSEESVDSVNTLISSTLQNIKKSLLCEE